MEVQPRFADEFATAPTHRNGHHSGRVARVIDGCQQVCITTTIGLDQQDIGLGRNGMCPFDIERYLGDPTRVGCGKSNPPVLIDFRENRVGQAKLRVEFVQVSHNIRIVKGIDDGDRRTSAVTDDGSTTKADIIEAIRMANLRWSHASG